VFVFWVAFGFLCLKRFFLASLNDAERPVLAGFGWFGVWVCGCLVVGSYSLAADVFGIGAAFGWIA
jgi:hypothetical protein